MVGYAYYGDGTATATTGSNVVIGQNTGWLSQIGTLTPIKAGDKFGIHVGNPIIIASIDSDTQITLEDAWPGPDQTEAAYKIELTNPSVIAIEAVRQLLASLSNGVLASLSTVPLDVDKIPIGIGPGVFGLIDKLALTQGVDYDVLVDTLSDRDPYDGQSEGYSVLVADNGDGRAALYVKNSNTSGDWSDPAYITGPVGPAGVNQRGNYSAVTAYEVDDLVQYGGSTWIAKVATTGNAPPTLPTVENTQWLLFVRSGTAGVVDRGAYSAVTAYVENDIVLDNGSTWIAIAPTTGNAPPILPTESNAYWRLLARKGTDGMGTGDVVGPAGGVTNNFPVAFDGVTGKLINQITGAIAALHALTPAADRMPYFTSGSAAELATLTSFARSILDDTTGAAMFDTMGATRVLAANGRENLPDGFQIKWGIASLSTADQRVNFPLAFPTACVAVTLACGTYYPEQDRLISATTSQVGASGFDIRSRNVQSGTVSGQSGVVYFWIAIGY